MIVKLLAFLLILVAGYLSWWAIEYAAPVWFLAAVLALVCGAGLIFRHRWASFLWYSLAFVTSAWWIFTILRMAFNGWPVQPTEETLISVIPGALLLVVCVGGTLAVRRKFRQLGPL